MRLSYFVVECVLILIRGHNSIFFYTYTVQVKLHVISGCNFYRINWCFFTGKYYQWNRIALSPISKNSKQDCWFILCLHNMKTVWSCLNKTINIYWALLILHYLTLNFTLKYIKNTIQYHIMVKQGQPISYYSQRENIKISHLNTIIVSFPSR